MKPTPYPYTPYNPQANSHQKSNSALVECKRFLKYYSSIPDSKQQRHCKILVNNYVSVTMNIQIKFLSVAGFHADVGKPGSLQPTNDLWPELLFQQLPELQVLSPNLSLVGNWLRILPNLYHQ